MNAFQITLVLLAVAALVLLVLVGRRHWASSPKLKIPQQGPARGGRARVFTQVLLVMDMLAFVPSLLLLIPAGMFFDGGYTLRAWIAFIAVAVCPISLFVGSLLAFRFKRNGLDGRAMVAAGAPLLVLPVGVIILAMV